MISQHWLIVSKTIFAKVFSIFSPGNLHFVMSQRAQILSLLCNITPIQVLNSDFRVSPHKIAKEKKKTSFRSSSIASVFVFNLEAVNKGRNEILWKCVEWFGELMHRWDLCQVASLGTGLKKITAENDYFSRHDNVVSSTAF